MPLLSELLQRRRQVTVGSILAVALALAVVVITAIAIPWHMDEFIMYHVLACWQPEQQLNSYRESCTAYPTELGPWEFQRSYLYAGITSSLILAPFFALVPSIWTPYAVGALFLGAIALGLTKALGLPLRFALVGIVFFPLLFTVLHDGGPVRLALMALVWTPVLAAVYLRARQLPKALIILAVSSLWMLATEDKPFFLFLIPGIAVFTLASLASRKLLYVARQRWKELLAFLIIPSTLCVALLVLLRVKDMPYLLYLSQQAPSPGLNEMALNAVKGGVLTFDWPYYAQRVSAFARFDDFQSDGLVSGVLARTNFLPGFDSPQTTVATALTMLVIAAVLVLYWRAWRFLRATKQPRDRSTVLLLLTSTSVLWLGAWISGGWASHHYIFAQVPLAALLMCAASKREHGLRSLTAVLVAIVVTVWLIIWLTPTRPLASRDIPRAAEMALSLAGTDSIINCATWGCYYTYSLLNKKQVPIVFADTAESGRHLEATAHGMRKEILHLCSGCSLNSVEEFYPRSDVGFVDSGTSDWLLFQVKSK